MDKKLLSLLTLIFQTTSVILLLRYSRIRSVGIRYLNSTAVFMSELLKAAACLVLVHLMAFDGRSGWRAIRHDASNTKLMLKLTIPAVLYTIQNNLIFVALSNLNSVVYQVTYQCKILTTALFSVLLLGRKLSLVKWSSLVCLTLGVCLIQVDKLKSDDRPSTGDNSLIGLAAVTTACVISGFSGVYFEKMLKKDESSVWMQNLFLATYSIVIALVNCYLSDGAKIRADGFLQGYSPVVWLVISLQAFGGLVIALVIKYADNIAKAFANALSIIFSAAASYILFNDLQISSNFLLGTGMVIGATFAYSHRGDKRSFGFEKLETRRYLLAGDREARIWDSSMNQGESNWLASTRLGHVKPV